MDLTEARKIFERWKNCKAPDCHLNISNSLRDISNCLVCKRYMGPDTKPRQFPKCLLCGSESYKFKKDEDERRKILSKEDSISAELVCKDCGYKSVYEIKTDYYLSNFT